MLPNQYLSINNEQTKNEFIIQIDKILNNLSMTRHNTAADKELPEDLPLELWAADCVWVRRGGHAPPLSTLYDGPYAVLQRSLRHFRLQLGNREDNVSTSRLKPCTGGAAVPMAAPPWRGWPRREPPAAPPSASYSTSRPHHRQRQLTLEPFFLASLPGFLHAQGKHLQAATRNATAGRLPGNGTAPSLLLAATKKLGGALWLPHRRAAYARLHNTRLSHDTQYCVTSPEPVVHTTHLCLQ